MMTTPRDEEPLERPYVSAPHIVRSRYSHAQWCLVDGRFALVDSTDLQAWRKAYSTHYRTHKRCLTT